MKRFEQDKFCESMRLRFDYNYMMSDFIGDKGLTEKELNDSENLCKNAFASFNRKRGKDMLGWSELPYEQDEIVESIVKEAAHIRKNRRKPIFFQINYNILSKYFRLSKKLFYTICYELFKAI